MRTRTQVEAMARNLCEKFNIKEVITPVFEHTVLFQRGVGETTDVVQKEMYTFVDKGGRSITLKPEGTAGAIRAYVENKLYAEPQPVKMFYITPAFRYEKPESGRLRQHHQFGVEFVGSPNPMAEVEVMTTAGSTSHQGRYFGLYSSDSLCTCALIVRRHHQYHAPSHGVLSPLNHSVPVSP